MTPESIKAAFELRSNAAAELRSIYDGAADRDLTAEEVAKEVKIDAEIRSLDERIARGLKVIADNSAADEARSAIEGLPSGRKEEVATVSEADQLRSLFTDVTSGKAAKATFESRDLLTTSIGGGLVPTTLYGSIYENLLANSTIMFEETTVLRTAGGEPLVIPRVTSYSAASIVAEAAVIPESDPAFDSVTLGAYKYAFITQVSSELVQDASFDVLGFLSRTGAVAMGNGIGAHLVSGTGTGQPNGIDNATVGVTTAATAAVTADELLSLIYSVPEQYRNKGTLLLGDGAVLAARKLKGTDGQYVWQPSAQLGQPDSLFGIRVATDPNLAAQGAGKVFGVFGDFRGYFTRLVGGIRVDVSTEYAFANDLITVRFIWRADGDIVDTVGIRTIKNAAS